MDDIYQALNVSGLVIVNTMFGETMISMTYKDFNVRKNENVIEISDNANSNNMILNTTEYNINREDNDEYYLKHKNGTEICIKIF